MNTVTLSMVVLVYLLLISYLGFLGYKKTKTSRDYLVAGREIHPFVMAVSYGATFISTAAIVGFGGIAANFGMGTIWLTFLNILVGIVIAFIFFGRRTRRMGHNIDAYTFPEFLGNRFRSRPIQILSGGVVFVAMPLYAAVVLIGGARFIESIFGLDFNLALTFFSIIIAAYVIAGGLKGVMYTDALQGTIMFLSLFFLLFWTYKVLGMGIVEANQNLTDIAHLVPEKLAAMGHAGWTAMPEFASGWWWILVTSIVMGVGIGVLAQPQLVVRFMTVKSNRELNRAVLIGSIFIFVSTGFIFTVGPLSNLFFLERDGLIAIQAVGGNVDLIIPEFINRAMPEWFVYIFMLCLLSAGMSTLSSQFHAMGSSIGRDFFEKIFKTNKEHTTLITRAGIILSIIISVLLGYNLPGSIIARGTAIFFGVCAATFLPVYFAALYWKRATTHAAFWSIVAGLLASVFSLVFIHQAESAPLGICQMIFGRDVLITQFPWMLIDPIVLSLPVSAIVLVLLTYLTPQIKKRHLQKCYKGIEG